MKALLTQCLAALTAASLLAGCGGGGLDASSRYVISSDRAAFYTHGPAQDYGPDLNLSQGEEVDLVKSGFGFSQVRTSTGKVGYVANDDLEAAPPPSPESASTGSSRDYTRSPSDPAAYTPAEDVALDIPLPEEEPKPVTSFRY